jgi:hypothetical protein
VTRIREDCNVETFLTSEVLSLKSRAEEAAFRPNGSVNPVLRESIAEVERQLLELKA